MANGEDPKRLWVSNEELEVKLDDIKRDVHEKPGRWEVRFLIVVAVLLAPVVPSATDVAQAAIGVFGGGR